MEENTKRQYDELLKELETKNKSVSEKPIHQVNIQPDSFITSEPKKTFGPVAGLRSSEPDNGNVGFLGKDSVLVPDFPLEYLALLEFLAAKNRHVSYAVENVVTLASTEAEIFFSDKISASLQSEMKQFLKDRADNYYEFSGGQTVLINDLFVQVAIHGAVSMEKIPLENLSMLKKVVRVSPKWIRFIYDKEKDSYLAVQQPRFNTARATVQGLIPLNPNTYSYIGYRHLTESPYAYPPFLSVIEDIITEYDMVGNFKTIMKKLGMLGLLQVMVTAPEQRDGEEEMDYYNRIQDFLRTKVVPEVEGQMARGVAVGIKDAVEIKLNGADMDVRGAETLMKIIKSMIFAGLKQDPNLHGENYSVTETFGKVILSKMSMQIRNYQQVVAKALEEIYMLDLVLAGYRPGYIEVKFKMPTISDQLKDEQAEQLKIGNVLSKRDAGIIDQIQAANELGYDKPAKKVAPEPIAPADTKKPDKNQGDVSNVLRRFLGANAREFDYSTAECGSFDASLKDPFLEKQTDKYNTALEDAYKKAINKAVGAMETDLAGRKFMNAEQMSDYVQFHLYKDWDSTFKASIKPLVREFIPQTYDHYRNDKSVFREIKKEKTANSFFTAPDGMYNLADFRSLEYLQNSDDFYLGKFITDKDTRKRITRFVQDWYIEKGNPIGADETLIQAFLKEFTEMINMESYKIRRITETTLNKSRNFASVLYIQQAQIAEFEIVEVNDQKTCAWCQYMDGKKFSVDKSAELIKKVTSNPVEDVPQITPFATSIKIEDFKKMDISELEKAGVVMPPYHGHCRGRVVANI